MGWRLDTGGGGEAIGFRLGPIQNVFTGADKAAAETARDEYATDPANATWLPRYNADVSLNIRLEYSVSGTPTVTYQVRNAASTLWLDNQSFEGVQGPAGADGLQLEFNSRANLDAFFIENPDRIVNGLPVVMHIGDNVVTDLVWNGPDNPTDYVVNDQRWRIAASRVSNNSLFIGSSRISNAVEDILVTTADGRKFLAVGVGFTGAGSVRLNDLELTAESTLTVNDLDNQVMTDPFTVNYSTFGNNLTTDFQFKPNEAGELRARFYLGADNTGSVIFDETRTVTQAEVDSDTFIDFGIGNPYLLDQGVQLFVEFSGIQLKGGLVSGGQFDGQLLIAFRSTIQGFTRHPVARQSEIPTLRTASETADLLETLTAGDRLDASAIKNLPSSTPRTDEEIRDVSYAGMVGGNGINVTVDDVANTVTISAGGGPPTGQEDFYHGLSSSNNPATVVLSTLTEVEVDTGSGLTFDFTIPSATLNDYVILLVPTDHDISTLVNSDTGFSVLGSYTRTGDVRTIGGDNYDSYTLGPLVAGFTANYRATLA